MLRDCRKLRLPDSRNLAKLIRTAMSIKISKYWSTFLKLEYNWSVKIFEKFSLNISEFVARDINKSNEKRNITTIIAVSKDLKNKCL